MEDVCAEMNSVDRLTDFAKVCEQADRNEDMLVAVKSMTQRFLSDRPMSVEQRNLLSVAFKNVVGSKRASWRVLDSLKDATATDEEASILKGYQETVERELIDLCMELEDLIRDRDFEETDGKIFFKKMAADYYRYMAEVQVGKSDGGEAKYAEQAEGMYKEAHKMAKESVQSADPILLGLALNYSVFLYEIAGQPENACELARTAFDEACKGLSEMDKGSTAYQDSAVIMQLIRDNLTLWSSENPAPAPEEDGTQVEDM